MIDVHIDVDADGLVDEVVRSTQGHPFFVHRGKGSFTPASELVIGDILELSSRQHCAVVKLENIEAAFGEYFTTYNFEVADFHTYFVGKSGVWVHNAGSFNCEKLFSVFNAKVNKFEGDAWHAFDNLVKNPPPKWAIYWPKRWKLRLMNRVRYRYFVDDLAGTPPWRSLDGQVLGGLRHPPTDLEANMLTKFGIEKPKGFTAHHLVPARPSGNPPYTPGSFADLRDKTNNKLDELGIDFNEAANGTYLPNKGSASFPKDVEASIYGPRHSPTGPGFKNIHNTEYMTELWNRLESVTDSNQARDVLQQFAMDLIDGKVPGAPLE